MGSRRRIAVAILAVLGGVMLTSGADAPRPELVVHEWGVMIRRTRSQLAPPDALIASLPEFVLRHDEHYKPAVNGFYGNGIQVWTKPVVHFYGREGQTIDLSIGTPKGRPLVYWPEPEILTPGGTRTYSSRGSDINIYRGGYAYPQQVQGMHWQGKLTAAPPPSVPRVRSGHWWNQAREVPSMYIKTDKGSERFVFYEGTAESQPSVTAAFSKDTVTLVNSDKQDSSPVVLIVADRDVYYAHYIESLPANKITYLSKSEICDAPIEPDDLLALCRRQWEACGMTAAEAKAIVEIWKEDLLRPVGCLLISRIPGTTYDAIFPLEMKPAPTELVRVGMVFDLVDDSPDRVLWLPHTQKHLQEQAALLDSEDFHVRQQAFNEIAAHLDLGESVAKSLVGHKDPEVDWRAKALLHRIALSRQRQPIPNALPVSAQQIQWTAPNGVIIDRLEQQLRLPQ